MSENLSRQNGTLSTLQQIIEDQRKEEKLLMWRHQWVPVFYNYLVALLVIALSVSLYGWALDIWAQRRADTQAAETLAAYQAEQQAAEDARQKELAAAQASEAAVMERETQDVAKAFYGIRLFVDKYHYTDKDLKTYARCMFNRVDAGNGVNDLHVIISTPEQFLGYYETSPVLDEFYTVAKEAVEEWHAETVKPCDLTYRYAELTESGIYLTNEFGADGYARRWQY